MKKSSVVICTLSIALSGFIGLAPKQTVSAQSDTKPSPARPVRDRSALLRQIQSLEEEKASRTPAQRKLDSQLHYAGKRRAGKFAAAGVPVLESGVKIDLDNTTVVNIDGKVSKSVLSAIEKSGGEVLASSERDGVIQARIPVTELENIAEQGEITFIRPAIRGEVNRVAPAALAPVTGTVNSEGDTTHRAQLARGAFNVNGSGVRIGVLSDSVRYLAQAQASGNLPPNVTVLPGQSGVLADNSDIGEGTAMLEIIHDLAPGARLFFATAFLNGNQSPTTFAANIRALRAAGCDIIVDDAVATFGPDGSPFQEGTVTAAINDVTLGGALYLSAAGNAGNFNDGTSGVWEGDFRDSGVSFTDDTGKAYSFHDFGNGQITTQITGVSARYFLYWSDINGRSANDYDIFLLDPDETTILFATTNIQNGTGDPFEFFSVGNPGVLQNYRLAIVRSGNAQTRALHLASFRGRFGTATAGQILGHNGAANAISVAATPAARFAPAPNPVGPFPGFFNGTNKVELFSSDGPRRLFYTSRGTLVSRIPGVTFASGGGRTLLKPELTAADGVSTTSPTSGLNPFFGTSAAAPHAAAIAALVKSANPGLSLTALRTILTTSTIDIEAPFWDRDSGSGILDAFTAVQRARSSSGSSSSCSSSVSNGICTRTICVNGNCTTETFALAPGQSCSCSSSSTVIAR